MTSTSAPVARLLNRQGAISGLVHGNVIPMGWDGTGINCYGMGMGQRNMSHGQP